MTVRVFLSYGRGDDRIDAAPDDANYYYDENKCFTRRLYNRLKNAGFKVWWDRENMPNRALTFLQEIRDAITNCDKLVLVVGEDSVESDYVRAEWEYALSICLPVIPILRNGDFPLIPQQVRMGHAVDFRDLDYFEQKCEELIRILNDDPASLGKLHGVLEFPEWYVPRAEDLRDVSQALRADGVQPIVVSSKHKTVTMHGMGGIGKTTLAAALCHDCDVRRFFPDGIFWLEMGKTPDIALRMGDIGEAFGVLREEFPDEARGKSRLGAILQDKAALIVLDDVWDYRHAAAFQITGSRCRLLITTRRPRIHTELGGVEHELDTLNQEEGLMLFANRLGVDRDALTETETLRAIIAHLGGHTLSLNIAAAKIKERGIAFAKRYLERLQTQENPFADLRLEDTEDRDVNVEYSLWESYRELSEDLQHRFRALGILAPEGTFDAHTAAAIWGDADTYDAEEALNELERANLLDRVSETRYSQHNLLRAYARALLNKAGEMDAAFNRYADDIIERITTKFDQLPPEAWEAAIGQDIPHVLYVGDELHRRYTTAPTPDEELEDRAQRFSYNITQFLYLRREVRRIEWLEMGLAISRRRKDVKRQALFSNELGSIYDDLGEKGKALEYYQQALPLRRAVGDKGGEAVTLNNIGRVYSALGGKGKALEYYQQALPLRRVVGDKGGEATTLNNIGGVYSALGEKGKALEYYQQALPLRREVGDKGGEAVTLNNIGRVYDDLGEKGKALEYFEQALPLLRAVGDKGGEAVTLNNIGGVYSALGEKGKALEYYQQALPLRREVGDKRGEAVTLNNIGGVYSALGEKGKALEYFQQVLLLLRAVGDLYHESMLCFNLGKVYEDLGKLDEAIAYVQRCVDLDEQVQHPNLESDRRVLHSLKRKRGDADAEPE